MQSNSIKFAITLFSRIWVAIISIFFIPIYVKIIGAESYGLVAFYGTLSGSLAILDLGLSTAVSRQVTLLIRQPDKQKDTKDLIFSVEIIYWIVAFLIGGIVILLAEPISLYWVKSKDLPIHTIKKSVMLMGVVFAAQFPASIYNGVLIGLDKQVVNALATIASTTLKAIGVIAVLKFVDGTIESYFLWQVIITFLSTYFLRLLVWRDISWLKEKSQFSFYQLKKIWKFATGMLIISLVTFFLGQIDKIIVSKLVLLEFVGYYNLAFMMANGISQVIAPMYPIIFPKFATLESENNQKELILLYHKSCRWISIIIFPIGITLILFAKEILILWTNNLVLTNNTAPILRVATAGTICNSMMWIPYWYLLAKGITKFTIYQNVIASLILVPLLFFWVGKYGALGASFVWLAVNIGYLTISLPIFHMLYLKGELLKWYKNDIAQPFFYAIIFIGIVKYIELNLEYNIYILLGITLFFIILYIILIPELRFFFTEIKSKYLKWRLYH